MLHGGARQRGRERLVGPVEDHDHRGPAVGQLGVGRNALEHELRSRVNQAGRGRGRLRVDGDRDEALGFGGIHLWSQEAVGQPNQ